MVLVAANNVFKLIFGAINGQKVGKNSLLIQKTLELLTSNF
jgi:hypothetical protein